jgi:hypothetical protein
VNAITQTRGGDQYLRLLTSYVGFRKQGLPYAPINRTGMATVRPKREAAHLARALVMDLTTHPLRLVLRVGLLLALLNLLVLSLGGTRSTEPIEWELAFALVVLAGMVAAVGEYVAALMRRLRDRPMYYVREEHTSSVLLREERTNVVGMTS